VGSCRCRMRFGSQVRQAICTDPATGRRPLSGRTCISISNEFSLVARLGSAATRQMLSRQDAQVVSS